MIPIRDSVRSSTFPVVNVTIIALNVLIFFYELSLGDYLQKFFYIFGLTPHNFFISLSEFNLPGVIIPLFTSIFLHGGWMHLIGNMWFLWIFGDNVEDSMGHGRYIVFYLLMGVGASLTHALFNAASTVPTVGASGAIAGVMGAYLVLYPRGRVLTLIPIFFFFQFIEIPAYIFLILWMVFQTLYGLATLSVEAGASGVAWWAHIGGFILGAILISFFRKQRPYYQWPEEW